MDSETEHYKRRGFTYLWNDAYFVWVKYLKRARKGEISPQTACSMQLELAHYLCSIIDEATSLTLTCEEPPFRGAADCES
jgi:hypothetical protein